MIKNIFVSAVVAVCVAWAVVQFGPTHETAPTTQIGEDKVLDNVERTGEVRCGYVNNPPFVSLNPNTHALSGIMVDVTDKIGQIAGWKIKWSSETSYPTMAEDMALGKFDVFCGGSWPVALSEKRQWWAGPLFYSGVAAFARTDDTRFDENFDIHKLNDPGFSISVIDGVAVDRVRAMEFPNAHVVALPNTSGYGEMITQVVDHKADVVLIEIETASQYMVKNPGKIHRIGGNTPIRYYGIGYEFPFQAPRLRNVFVAAMHELIDGNDINKILGEYEVTPGMFYRVSSSIEKQP